MAKRECRNALGGDYIKPLLEKNLSRQSEYSGGVLRILELLELYQKAICKINSHSFVGSRAILSERETEISQLAAEGFSNKEIGEILFISENTVKTQLKSIFKKLEINSRVLLRQYLL